MWQIVIQKRFTGKNIEKRSILISKSLKTLSNLGYTPFNISQVCRDITDLSPYPIHIVLQIEVLPL